MLAWGANFTTHNLPSGGRLTDARKFCGLISTHPCAPFRELARRGLFCGKNAGFRVRLLVVARRGRLVIPPYPFGKFGENSIADMTTSDNWLLEVVLKDGGIGAWRVSDSIGGDIATGRKLPATAASKSAAVLLSVTPRRSATG